MEFWAHKRPLTIFRKSNQDMDLSANSDSMEYYLKYIINHDK